MPALRGRRLPSPRLSSFSFVDVKQNVIFTVRPSSTVLGTGSENSWPSALQLGSGRVGAREPFPRYTELGACNESTFDTQCPDGGGHSPFCALVRRWRRWRYGRRGRRRYGRRSRSRRWCGPGRGRDGSGHGRYGRSGRWSEREQTASAHGPARTQSGAQQRALPGKVGRSVRRPDSVARSIARS